MQNGNYQVLVEGNDGCMSDTSEMVSFYLGISDNTVKSFEIYPNPSNGLFNLHTYGNISGSYEIFNIEGVKLSGDRFDKNYQEIDLRMLGSGVYIFKVYINDNFFIQKIIVKH